MAESWKWTDPCADNVLRAAGELDWCDRLESAPDDPVTGKVLCVCVAMAIAEQVRPAKLSDVPEHRSKPMEPLALLNAWIDNPTEDRFEQICNLIFDEDHLLPDELNPHGIVWWTLRVATSSVGNHEAGWALSTVCRAAEEAGLTASTLRDIARRTVQSRQRSQ